MTMSTHMETDSITITSILNIKQILDKKNQISKIIGYYQSETMISISYFSS